MPKNFKVGGFRAGDTVNVGVTAGGLTRSTGSTIFKGVFPAITGAPVITGTPVEGNTMTATPATVSAGTPTPTTSYIWQLDDVDQTTEEGISTFVLPAGSGGKTLTVIQLATNALGTFLSISDPVEVTLANDPPLSTGATLASDKLSITVTFDQVLDLANDTSASDWSLTVNGSPHTISAAAINPAVPSQVTLTLATAAGDVGTVALTYSGTTLRNDTGQTVAGFSENATRLNFQIVASSTSGIAPHGVIFHIEGLTDDEWKHALIEWDFGDPGSTYDLLPVMPATVFSDPNYLRDANKGFGPVVAHTFEGVASYTVTCNIWTSLAQVDPTVLTVGITVTDPETFYAPTTGVRTVCISEDGDFTGAPAGSVQETSWDDAAAYIKTTGGRTRFLFPRGKSTTVRLVDNNNRLEGPTDIVTFGAFGAGTDRAILTANEIWLTSNCQAPGVIFKDIHFDMLWDARTLTGFHKKAIYFNSDTTWVTAHNCKFEGAEISLRTRNEGGDASPIKQTRLIMTNCDFSGPKGFSQYHTAYGSVYDWAIVGCKLQQSHDALNWRGLDNSSLHGPCRDTGVPAGVKVRQQNWHFSNTGRNIVGNRPAHQPCDRLAFNSKDRFFMNVSRNLYEGGNSVLSLGHKDDATGGESGALVRIESNIVVGTANTVEWIALGRGNTVFRNNILLMPNVPFELQTLNRIGSEDSGSDTITSPVEVLFNTVVDLRTTANGSGVLADITQLNKITNLVVAGNLKHAPNRDTPLIGATLLDAANPIYTAIYKGLYFTASDGIIRDERATYASAGQQLASYRPRPGSSALGAETVHDSCWYDFEGTRRSGGATATGAFHGAL